MALSSTSCPSCNTPNRAGSAFCNNCGSPLTGGGSPSGPTGRLASGQVLKQRYRIIQIVGRGGMGAVYKAEDIQFGDRLVAVKEMRQTGLDPQELKKAADDFKQEAVLLAGLKHPSLPSIYDHFSENGRWYLVMDFIEGETLAEHLNKAKEKVLPVPEVLDIGIQLSKVLGYLHTRTPNPVIFRDLSPSNVMFTPDGHVYLIDFGIARFFKRQDMPRLSSMVGLKQLPSLISSASGPHCTRCSQEMIQATTHQTRTLFPLYQRCRLS